MEVQKKSKSEKDETRELVKVLPKLIKNKEFKFIIQRSRLLAKKTNSHIIFNILGFSLLQVGKKEEATIYLEKSLELNQDFLPVYKNLAKAYFKLGNYAASEKLLKDAIKKFPTESSLLDQLSELFIQLKDLVQANYYLNLSNGIKQTFKKVFKLAKINLVIAKNENSQSALKKSLVSLYAAFQFLKEDDQRDFYQFTLVFYSTIKLFQYNKTDIEIFSRLLKTDHWEKALPILRKNYLNPALAKTYMLTKSNDDQILSENALTEISELPLLKEVLVLQTYPNLKIEKLLKKIRRSFLFNREDIKNIGALTKLLESLAINSLLTEYLFDCTNDEKLELSKITNLLTDQYLHKKTYNFYILIVLCYQNLAEVAPDKMLGFFKEFPALKSIFFDAPLKEKKLSNRIKKFGYIEKASSITREQYEANPYPRWHKYPLQISFRKFNEFLLTQELNPRKFVQTGNHKKDILIAGCGTGLNVFKVASGFPDSDITAVDLSLSSLAYAKRKVEEANLKGISFYHGDISQIAKINKTYDYIECMGVLHHIEDYLQVWQSLTECLKKNGIMRVGLYSSRARSEIINFRKRLNQNFSEISKDKLIYERQKIINGKQNFSFTASTDFFSRSGVRDLLFNVYEKQFNLLEIEEVLNKLNLDFLGVQMKNTEIRSVFKKLFPKNEDWFVLANWDTLENNIPSTFVGMYQFWCQKNNL